MAKNRTNDHTGYFVATCSVFRARAFKARGEDVMPHYLFHLSDGEDTFIDDTGKQLEDNRAAHVHALRIIEKIRRLIPDAANSTWKIRITLATGHSVMTVISPALGELYPNPSARGRYREKTRGPTDRESLASKRDPRTRAHSLREGR
jgi:hypothetical protein